VANKNCLAILHYLFSIFVAFLHPCHPRNPRSNFFPSVLSAASCENPLPRLGHSFFGNSSLVSDFDIRISNFPMVPSVTLV
jgi:hypothetical protein